MASTCWRLWMTAFVVAFGASFQSGYFISLYNVPQDIIENYVNESIKTSLTGRTLSEVEVTTIWAAIASSNQAGKVLAVFITPFVCDKIGRRHSFFISDLISILGILLQCLAQPTGKFLMLAIGRFLSGFYTGIVGVLVPLFLVEIAVVPHLRGSVTRIHNIVTIIGNILAFVFGVPDLLGTKDRWGYLAIIPLPLILLQTIWMFFVPDSPLYLMQRGRNEAEVQKSLRFYLGKEQAMEFAATARAAVEKKQLAKVKAQLEPKIQWTERVGKIVGNSEMRKIIFLWIVLAASSAFSGGSVTQNFLTSMVASGADRNTDTFSTFSKYASVIINSVKIFFVLAALYVIDRFGRRPLLLSTIWSVLVCLIALAAIAFGKEFCPNSLNYSATVWTHLSFLFLLTSIQYVVNSTATLIVSETAKQRARALSLSIFKLAYHGLSVALTFIWPPLSHLSDGGSYLLLAVPYLVTCIYLSVACPETKSIDLFGQENKEKISNGQEKKEISNGQEKIEKISFKQEIKEETEENIDENKNVIQKF